MAHTRLIGALPRDDFALIAVNATRNCPSNWALLFAFARRRASLCSAVKCAGTVQLLLGFANRHSVYQPNVRFVTAIVKGCSTMSHAGINTDYMLNIQSYDRH
jgi:hypothetical protein